MNYNQPVVSIQNGCKTFRSGEIKTEKDDQAVLKNLNMTVPKGTLYSIIGSSGCGKTTLLSCLLGLLNLDNGDLFVFGNKNACINSRQSIGYMPQETCLYDTFSIYETLFFFGTMFGLKSGQVGKYYLDERIRFLRKLLMLPNTSRIVGTLSVWNHLRHLCDVKGTTVILTTHYIDEAKHSNIVGVMRDGRLIAEASPTALMQKHQEDSLEGVFLKLCKQVVSDRHDPITGTSTTRTSFFDAISQPPKTSSLKYSLKSLKRVFALVGKNYKCMFRKSWMLAFITLIPALCMYIACVTFQNEPQKIPFGLVNNDLESGKECVVGLLDGVCSTDNLSCNFITKISSKTFHVVPFKNEESAKKAVELGQIWGYLNFPNNYSSFITQRFIMGAHAFTDNAEEGNDIWNGSIIKLSLDQTNTLISGVILQSLHTTLEISQMKLLETCGLNSKWGEFPLKYSHPIVGGSDLSTLSFIAPGLAVGILFFFPLTVSIRFIAEKKQGTMDRLFVGGTQMWEILIAYFVLESWILILQSVFIYLILFYGFNIGTTMSSPTTMLVVLLVCVLQGLGGLASGFLLGVLFKEESQAAVTIIAIIFPSSFISGILWPLEGMPKILQYVAPVFPMTLPAESLRSLIIRGWNVYTPSVYGGIFVSVAYIFISIGFTVKLLKK